MDYVNCELCPRRCGVNRKAGKTGWCRCPDTALVAKTMIHKWEEPALAGAVGSGAIFFGSCTMGCIYCQNKAISDHPCGALTTSGQLRQIMEELISQGAENIDLVSPTPYLPTILPALEPKLPVPVVMLENEVTAEKMYAQVMQLLGDDLRRAEMTGKLQGLVRADSADAICDIIEELVQK